MQPAMPLRWDRARLCLARIHHPAALAQVRAHTLFLEVAVADCIPPDLATMEIREEAGEERHGPFIGRPRGAVQRQEVARLPHCILCLPRAESQNNGFTARSSR